MYIHMQSVLPCNPRNPPNHVLCMCPSLFIKKTDKKRVQTGAGRQWKAAETESSCLSGGKCGSVYDGVCFCRGGGAWELTFALNNLIERHPPALIPGRSGRRTLRDSPLPMQQFAVWEAQRGGQGSNKCSYMEIRSHGNAFPNDSASFWGH